MAGFMVRRNGKLVLDATGPKKDPVPPTEMNAVLPKAYKATKREIKKDEKEAARKAKHGFKPEELIKEEEVKAQQAAYKIWERTQQEKRAGAQRAEIEAGPLPKQPNMEDPTSAVRNISRWRTAPWVFVREVMGAEPDDWQDEALHALIEAKDPEGVRIFMLCMKACKGPGKTTLLAWVIWWFMLCFTHPKILCTSITGENLKDGLWAELAKWQQRSLLLITMFEWQSERIYAKQHKETWFASARTWPRDADKTKQANTLAGQHATNSMVIVDEGGDIPEGVVAAGLAHHSTQGKELETHYTIMAGNPTRVDGALGVACTRDRAKWWVKEITGDPNDPKRAKRIDLAWAKGEIEKWGADHDWVRINVYGQFPRVQDNKLLGPDQVKASMDAVFPEAAWMDMPRIMGVDVARSLASDLSCLVRRQGPVVFPLKTWRLDDLMELASAIAWEYSQWPAQAIFVDVGGLGAGVVDRLSQLGLPVVGVNFGAQAKDPNRFADKRTEMWWDMHLAIKGVRGSPAIALPTDSELLAELCGPIAGFNDRSRLKLESKRIMKERGLNSPDRADALALTYAEQVFAEIKLPGHTQEALTQVRTAHSSDYDPYADHAEA